MAEQKRLLGGGRTTKGFCVSTAQTTKQRRNTATATKSARSRLFSLALIFCSGFGGLVLFVVVFGRVTGDEFCPATFRRRDYSFYEFPVIRVQVSPVWRDNATESLESYVGTQNWLKPSTDKRWDVINVLAGSSYESGNASIYVAFADHTRPASDETWLDWSQSHGDLAEPFWLAVQQVSLLDAYELLPEMFGFAQTADDEIKFRAELFGYLERRLEELASDYESAGEAERAAELRQAKTAKAGSWLAQLRDGKSKSRRTTSPDSDEDSSETSSQASDES